MKRLSDWEKVPTKGNVFKEKFSLPNIVGKGLLFGVCFLISLIGKKRVFKWYYKKMRQTKDWPKLMEDLRAEGYFDEDELE